MLQLLTHMEWPFAFVLVAIAAGCTIVAATRRTTSYGEKIEELKLKRAIQLEAFKKGALSYCEAPEIRPSSDG